MIFNKLLTLLMSNNILILTIMYMRNNKTICHIIQYKHKINLTIVKHNNNQLLKMRD